MTRHRVLRAELRTLAGLCAALVLAGCASSPPRAPQASVTKTPPPPDAVKQAIVHRLDTTPHETPAARAALLGFYDQRDDAPAWFAPDARTPRDVSGQFIDYLKGIDRQGLSRRHYIDSTTWAALQVPGVRRPDALARQDIALSRAFLGLARDIDNGRVHNAAIRSDWRHDPDPTNDDARLTTALQDDDPSQVLNALQPDHAGYRELIAALAHYRDIQSAGGWPRIASGPTLRAGMQDPRIPTLRERLHITGDLDDPSATAATARTYTPRLADAVRHFQRRHGLDADGRVGPDTLTALDVPVGVRIDTLKLNLERWRWMPRHFGPRYIAVNIPAFSLTAVDDGVTELAMNVIVGGAHDNRATPVFADRMRYLIFRPFWNVPHHIAVDEIVPHARRDPQYMADRGYQIVKAFAPHATPLPVTPQHLSDVVAGRLQIRQAGGRGNALGLVKFMFPNPYAVYLHSTPATSLFSRSQRDLSHGCVRVADPVALARFALAGRRDWNTARIQQAMHQGGRQRVNLAQPLPVYLMYWTAFVNADGVNFRRDIYGRDARLGQALAAAPGGSA
ncbi:L,D-transpeptidase family protein [Salinisphaera hydrothermalis]|uniref:Peptidoglycan binding domain-containing protein n=1 Tax=Salinisphaera hydrothermalis (strain C41B8) TaxID=1304275 RepID=A0A084IPZ7_SALHC|nr:L,D-transpeptidase family protein [Salinisphaera hydrothermalis]KEZ78781.1 peptidoglycan binding domain-containing protein [Salinisphaera hydrothermalis C41B8]